MRVYISTSNTTQEAVNAINRKLGTSFTIFDYRAWESGADTEGARQFSSAVEQYVGGTSYKVVTALALAALKIRRLLATKPK